MSSKEKPASESTNFAYEGIDDPLETFIVPYDAQRRMASFAIEASFEKSEDS